MEDNYYIDKFLEGKSDAFETLLERHQNFVYSLALSLLKDADEAADATQDTFIKCYQKLDTFQKKSSFETWLYRIAYHQSLGRLRQTKKSVSLEVHGYPKEVEFDTAKSQLDKLQEQEQVTYIKAAIEKLSPNEALVLTLFYLKEQSIKDIEIITDLSSSNIKTILSRGRVKLKESLNASLKTEVKTLYQN